MRAEIVRWFADRGYGFAKPATGSRDLVVHVEDVIDGQPYVGATIDCEVRKVVTDQRRKMKACKVRIIKRGT